MQILVIGAGVSGAAAAGLAARVGDTVSVYDANPGAGSENFASDVLVTTGAWSPDLLDGADVVVASPGVPEGAQPLLDAIQHEIPVWSEIEYASRFLHAPMVAVTGTNGKTTVTALIAEMANAGGLRTIAAGNIGVALSQVADEDWDLVVVEVSSFQLRFIDEFHPSVAVILNVADDHLDWHGTFEKYAAAKARIFENMNEAETLIFDLDDPGASSLAQESATQQLGVSGTWLPESGFGVDGTNLVLGDSVFSPAERNVQDPAYLLDLCAAGAAARTSGVSAPAVADVVRSFVPGRHRREMVLTQDGVTWINDSKATNPHAALAAIGAYRSVVLIAGGRNKDLDITPLATAPSVKQLIALGETAGELLATRSSGVMVETMEEAVLAAAFAAESGDVVLLAPGCTSFDMFSDYQARGDAFRDLVNEKVRL